MSIETCGGLLPAWEWTAVFYLKGCFVPHKKTLFYVAVVDVPVCPGVRRVTAYALRVGRVRPCGGDVVRVWNVSALTARAAVRKLRETVVAFAYQCEDGGNKIADLQERGRKKVNGEPYLRKYFALDLHGDPAFEVV